MLVGLAFVRRTLALPLSRALLLRRARRALAAAGRLGRQRLQLVHHIVGDRFHHRCFLILFVFAVVHKHVRRRLIRHGEARKFRHQLAFLVVDVVEALAGRTLGRFHQLNDAQQIRHERVGELGPILHQHLLEAVELGVLLGQVDDELGQILVVDAQMVVQFGADARHQRQMLQFQDFIHCSVCLCLVSDTQSECAD